MHESSYRTGFYGLLLFALAVLPFGAEAAGEQVIKVQTSTYEESEDTLRTAGFGLSFGILGANGFSYRKLPQHGAGYQLGGIALVESDWKYFKLSAQYLYGLSRTRLTCFYFVAGISYKYNRAKDADVTNGWTGEVTPGKWVTRASRWAVGAGFGLGTRKLLHERVWGSVELPLTYDGKTLLPWPTATVHYMIW